MKSFLIDCNIFHERFKPKMHRFKNRFFWFALDLSEIESVSKDILFFSRERFNIFSFYEKDHFQLIPGTLKENCQYFLKQNNIESEITKIVIYTHLRMWNYLFNPVSLLIISTNDLKEYSIIEIGNTFNEIKPYFVHSENFYASHSFKISMPKMFYISPFISHDAQMTFHVSLVNSKLSVEINDYEFQNNIKSHTLKAALIGKSSQLTNIGLIKRIFQFPLMSFKIIAFIHWHALILFLKNIPYQKKAEHLELQQKALKWKR